MLGERKKREKERKEREKNQIIYFVAVSSLSYLTFFFFFIYFDIQYHFHNGVTENKNPCGTIYIRAFGIKDLMCVFFCIAAKSFILHVNINIKKKKIHIERFQSEKEKKTHPISIHYYTNEIHRINIYIERKCFRFVCIFFSPQNIFNQYPFAIVQPHNKKKLVSISF